jgi:hypothetical protein
MRREVHRAHQNFFISQAHLLTEVAEDLHIQERLLAGLPVDRDRRDARELELPNDAPPAAPRTTG